MNIGGFDLQTQPLSKTPIVPPKAPKQPPKAGVEITPKFLIVSRTTYLGNLVVLRHMW